MNDPLVEESTAIPTWLASLDSQQRSKLFEEWWIACRDQIQRRVRRKLRTVEDADDAFQDIAMRAARGFGACRATTSSEFSNWVQAITTQQINTAIRRYYDPVAPIEQVQEQLGEFAALDPVDVTGDVVDLENAIRRCLPEQEARLVLARHWNGGVTWEELIPITGLSSTHAPVSYQRAMNKLRVNLLVSHPEFFGGRDAIAMAIRDANADSSTALTPDEESVFRSRVLGEDTAYSRQGSTNDLRTACQKVGRCLSLIALK